MRNVALLLALLTAGCAHYPVNPPLAKTDLSTGYRWATTTIPSQDNSTFVVLTFSGGGTRAAGLSFSLLKQLEATPMPAGGTLLDEVDVISSVSGGSFASMEYGLRKKRMLADFEDRFLRKPVQDMLFRAAFLTPRNWIRLLSPSFHRIDVAAEVYDQVLFENKTFDDLLSVQHAEKTPLIIANATELEIGSQFQWTQDQFDPICSDLSTIHVSRAVAASSDFPVLLPPMVLKKYDAQTCGYRTPRWLPLARDNDAYLNPARPRYATELEGYLHADRRFLHLMDGGIADNIGLRGPFHALTSTDTFVQPDSAGRTGFTLLPLINQRKIKRLLVIVVNAGTQGPVTIDRGEREPKLRVVLGGVVGTPMDNYSFDSIDLLLRVFGQRAREDTKYYPVLVSFSLLRDAALRDTVNGIGTSFNALSEVQLAALKQAADILLHQDPCFQRFMRDVRGEPSPPDAPVCGSVP